MRPCRPVCPIKQPPVVKNIPIPLFLVIFKQKYPHMQKTTLLPTHTVENRNLKCLRMLTKPFEKFENKSDFIMQRRADSQRDFKSIFMKSG